MEAFTSFLTILAWIFGAISALFMLARIYMFWYYTSTKTGKRDFDLQNLSAMTRGYKLKPTLSLTKPGFVFIICTAWIISTW